VAEGVHGAGQKVEIRVLACTPGTYAGRPELTEGTGKIELPISLIHFASCFSYQNRRRGHAAADDRIGNLTTAPD
jgi:hypothetical protein